MLLSADVAARLPSAVVEFAPLVLSGSSIHAWDDSGNTVSPPGSADVTTGLKLPAPAGAPAEGLETGPIAEIGPPSPEELAAAVKMPWASNHSHIGTLDASAAATIRIPVGPSTRLLTLLLEPGTEGGTLATRIDQVYLLDRLGRLLARLQGVAVLGEDGSQGFHVAIHGAPAGGEIVVRLAPPLPAATAPAPGWDPAGSVESDHGGVGCIGDGDGGEGRADSSFKLSVERGGDGFGSEAGYGSSIPATANVARSAAFDFAPIRSDAWISVITPTATSEATTIAPARAASPRASVAATRATTRRDVDNNAADRAPVSVFLGPLVSRGAAAVGPALATNADDPAPAVGRGARARADGAAAFAAELDMDSILAVRSRGQRGDDAEFVADDSSPTTLRGPGGVPIAVAGLRAGDEADDAEAETLAASAVAAVRDGSLLADAAAPEETVEGGRVEVARAGLATRALSFLVGMGLASGPLYPDLVALARRKFRRKPRRSRTGRGPG